MIGSSKRRRFRRRRPLSRLQRAVRRWARRFALLFLLLFSDAAVAHSADTEFGWIDSLAVARRQSVSLENSQARPALVALVPEVARDAFAIAPGPRAFRQRIWLSPAGGKLGQEPLYAFRIGFQPSRILGYELSLAHSDGKSAHAALYRLQAMLRAPLPGRIQPFACFGYGMAMVFPGRALNADPVTRNALTGGGGMELFVREDLALRGEWQRTSVLGAEPQGDRSVAYDYSEFLIGLTFHRRTGATAPGFETTGVTP